MQSRCLFMSLVHPVLKYDDLPQQPHWVQLQRNPFAKGLSYLPFFKNKIKNTGEQWYLMKSHHLMTNVALLATRRNDVNFIWPGQYCFNCISTKLWQWSRVTLTFRKQFCKPSLVRAPNQMLCLWNSSWRFLHELFYSNKHCVWLKKTALKKVKLVFYVWGKQ